MATTKKVVFCVPTMTRPFQQTLDSLRDSIPEIVAAGWDEGMVSEIGCPYISCARATMLRKALTAKATQIIFIDHDVSWTKGAVLKLLETPGDVVAGTYRFKYDKEEYMGKMSGPYPTVRADGCIKMIGIPAGFLRVSRTAIMRLMRAYPELVFGPLDFDLFNHGAFEGAWWGEDYAFCRRWMAIGGNVWCVPDLDITHHTTEKAYPGNFHMYMRRQPGGDLSDSPILPKDRK